MPLLQELMAIMKLFMAQIQVQYLTVTIAVALLVFLTVIKLKDIMLRQQLINLLKQVPQQQV